MSAKGPKPTHEVFVLGISAQDVETLLHAMASVNPPQAASAELEVIDLVTPQPIPLQRGPFEMPAVAA